jgi:hypothetical protein
MTRTPRKCNDNAARPAPSRVGRRSVLASATMALLAGAMPAVVRPARSATRDSCDAVTALWSDAERACRIGRSYLAQVPEDADPDRLAAILLGEQGANAGMSADALRARFALARMRDFEAGDTVIVDGWVLARTEARLCALTALA